MFSERATQLSPDHRQKNFSDRAPAPLLTRYYFRLAQARIPDTSGVSVVLPALDTGILACLLPGHPGCTRNSPGSLIPTTYFEVFIIVVISGQPANNLVVAVLLLFCLCFLHFIFACHRVPSAYTNVWL